MEYFSSDWHLGHKNILQYDNRPFKTIEEHDAKILENYNSVVGENDTFYFLGDFALGHFKNAENILRQMNGKKFFILGNHDEKPMQRMYRNYGTVLGNLYEIEPHEQKIVICHYSMRVWRGNHKGNWHLFGHSHGSLDHLPNGKSFDVAINKSNYFPLSFDTVKQRMDDLEVVALDHHTRFTAHR